MTYHYHDESIVKSLPENTVFVFGSNLAGQHAGGAARTAYEHFGAVMGLVVAGQVKVMPFRL